MRIIEVPKAYDYGCDGCFCWHRQENANGHYTNSTPPEWLLLAVRHGQMKDGTTSHPPNNEYLFCEKCKEGIQKSILNNLDEIPF